MRSSPAAAALLVLLAAAPAQTFVVDAANGPGAQFTTLAAAVAAVPDGAVLLVRPGTYAGFTLSGKGLAILGDPGTLIQGTIAIAHTQPRQAVTLRELQWVTAQLPTGNVLLSLDACQGPVLLERLDQPPHQDCLPGSVFVCDRTTGVNANACAQLSLLACTIRCTARLTDCDAVLTDCTLVGEDFFFGFRVEPGRTPLVVTRGRAQVAGNTLLRGGLGNPTFGHGFAAAGDGIVSFDGELRLLGGRIDTDLAFAAAIPLLAPHTVYEFGTATHRISPRVQLHGTAGPTAGTDVMPQLTGSGAAANGTLDATVTTETGDLAILVVGLPGPPAAIPGVRDAFWLDPVVHVFEAIGVQTATPVAASIAVPPTPSFQGVRLNWQAACLGPVTGFQATNPLVTLVY